MDNRTKVLIVIPTYNENESINDLCLEILENENNWNVLVVDDGSTDGTDLKVVELSIKYIKRIDLLQRGKKLGVGSAHIDGINWGIQKRYDFIVTMDADGTHETKSISSFLEKCNHYDICVGSRYMAPNSLAGWTLWRKTLTYFVHNLTKLTLGLNFDNSSGFRAYSVKALLNVDMTAIKSANYDFFFESLLYFKKIGLQISETPISLPKRTAGHSKLTLRLAISALKTLMKLILKHRIFNHGYKKI